MVTPVRNKEDLLLRLQAVRDEIKARGVVKLGLFGSFVSGDSNEASDVDFLVQFDPQQKNFDNFMGLSFMLEKVLHRTVELVTTEAMSPYLGPQILSEVEDVPFDQ